MSVYKHGVYASEIPTSLLPPRKVGASLPVVFGTAPIESREVKPVNEPVLCYTYAEFVEALGWSDDWGKYTLCEFADAWFGKYGLAPAVFVNVFDPATHLDDAESPDPIRVTSADIIGGVDADTGTKTGLELISSIFPRFRMVPGQILAPRYSMDPSVAIVMAAKAVSMHGLFRCMALVDIDDTQITKYADVPAYKESMNLTGESMIVGWGRPVLGDAAYHFSTHLACGLGQADADSDDIPYRSPSNRRALVNGFAVNGKTLSLGLDEANYLNGQGLVTLLNWDGGWKFWGNRTAAYPSVTDPKDAFIPLRRVFGWYGNRLVLSYLQKVDQPLTRRLLQAVVDSENVFINGLVGREIFVGGRIDLLDVENPITDVMDGITRFHVWLSPPPPAERLEFILEYDPTYLETLFAQG